MADSRFKIQDSRYCFEVKKNVLIRVDSWCRNFVFLCFFVLAVFSSVVSAEELPRGQVIPKVACEADTQKTYALYLPSYYTPEKKFPIIYAFEPAARGVYPVERFKAAAEKFGYIIVASNDSRNGLAGKELLPIVNNMLEDTDKRFSIDRTRVYFTGFSGGARVALSYAVMSNGLIAGVIICGAGFSPDVQPTKDFPFVIFGTVGDEDFNYFEMRLLDENLTKLSIAHRFVIFQGGHDWASSELCIKAIEWLELQAMRTDRRAKDEAFVESLWKRDFEEANKLEANGKIYDAFVLFNALSQDFKGLKDVSEIKKKVSSLRENKAVKQALKDEKDEIGKQKLLSKQLISQGANIMQADSPERPQMMQDLRSLASDIRKRAQATEDTSDRRVARRTIREVFVYYYETALHTFLPQKKTDLAILYMEIATELSPKNANAFVELARICAIAKQKKKAFQALEKAIENGFNDLKPLEENKDFDNLRAEKEWQKLIDSIKQKASSKDT